MHVQTLVKQIFDSKWKHESHSSRYFLFIYNHLTSNIAKSKLA